MKDDLIKLLDNKNSEQAVFIKTTGKLPRSLNAQQKVLLNRKGNVFFNEGNVEAAKRIFMATGYSDGLTRVGDVYIKDNKHLDALEMFVLAHNTRKAEPLYEKIAETLSSMLKE